MKRGLGAFLIVVGLTSSAGVGGLAWLARDLGRNGRIGVLIALFVLALSVLLLIGVNRYLAARVALAPYDARRAAQSAQRAKPLPPVKRVDLPAPRARVGDGRIVM